MKRASVVLMSVLVLALIASPFPAIGAAKGKTHDVTVQFVKYDAEAQTLTFKTETGEEHTAPVMEKATKALAKVKPGEMVVLACQDDEDGEHEGIAAVKPAKPVKKAV